MDRVFISYRHNDRNGYLLLLEQLLRDRFDVAIDFRQPTGTDINRWVRETIVSSATIIVLIDKDWVTATNVGGKQRLSVRDDWVRLELKLALDAGIPVIPMLLPGALMPRAADLPRIIRYVTAFKAFETRQEGFGEQITARFVPELQGVIRREKERQSQVRGAQLEAFRRYTSCADPTRL